MYQEDDMEVSLSHLINWVPINFGEKSGDETTYYRAQDQRNGQIVFVKKINLFKDIHNEYQTEINALTELKGTNNIIDLVETGIESKMIGRQMQDFGFILLSYAGEIDLCDAICNYRWKYQENDFISFSHSLIQAVHKVHSKGFIHRDLKLENIVLDNFFIDKESGEFSFSPESFSIIDFGSSLNVNDYYFNNDPSILISFRRTQKYSSPEFINECKLTSKYDVFSVGVILFSLITQHFPKFNYSMGEDGIIYRFLPYENAELFDENEWANVSDEIKSMIKSMLSYDPLYRPSTNDLLKLDIFRCQTSQFIFPFEEDEAFY